LQYLNLGLAVGFFRLFPNASEVGVAVAVKLGDGNDSFDILGGEMRRLIDLFFKSLGSFRILRFNQLVAFPESSQLSLVVF
jgi:hypothetical protein